MTLDRRDYKTSIPQLEARLSAIEKVGNKSLTNFDVLQDLLEKEIAERQRLYLKQDTSINTITVKMYYVIKDYGVTPTTDDVGWAETMPKMDYSNDDKVLWYMTKTFRNGAVIETSIPQKVQLMDGVFAFINSVADADNNWTTIDGGKISTGRIQDNINGDNYFDLDSGEFNFQDSNGNYVRQNGNGIQIQGTLSLSSAVGSGTLNDIVEDMADFAQDVIDINNDIDDLQSQIDGNITTWFYAYEPTLNDPPVTAEQGVSGTGWDTDEKKDDHLGDLFYDTTTGYAYRFMKENNTYSWAKITDSDVTEALRLAGEAQDTADHKRRVFVTTPTPPYDVGDLWAEGSSGDIKKCKTAKVDGQSYSASDWERASKYTDDTVATNALGVANGADFRTQYIYISKVSGTNTVSANTTWVSDATGNQNTWTTKRPQYSSSYPVLFIAKQSQTMAQSGGSTCSCTTPVKDDTTTVIDGGHITTGTIDASRITATVVNAINATADKIDAKNINVDGTLIVGASDVDTAIDNAKQIKTDTASGSVATFTGSEYPAVSVVTDIEPKQSGSGTPSPSNPRAISGYTSINTFAAEKNLLHHIYPTNTVNYVTFTLNADYSVTANGTASANAERPLTYRISGTYGTCWLKAGTYKLLGCPSGGGSSKYEIGINTTINGSGVTLARDYGSGATFTLADDGLVGTWITVRNGVTVNNLVFRPMIVVATETDTTYEPYNGNTYTTPLPQTVYGGTLDVTTGVLTVDRAYVNAKNKTWSLGGGGVYVYSNFADTDKTQKTEIVTNIAQYTSGGSADGYVSWGGTPNNGNMIFRNSTIAPTLADWNTYIANNDVQIVYYLATPQTYSVSPQQIQLLQGTNNLWTNSGDVNVTYAIISADAVEALNNPIDGASKVATSYITQIDNGGIKVHDAGDTSNYSQINSNGMEVVKGGVSTAKFGEETRVGKKSNFNTVLNSERAKFKSGNYASEIGFFPYWDGGQKTFIYNMGGSDHVNASFTAPLDVTSVTINIRRPEYYGGGIGFTKTLSASEYSEAGTNFWGDEDGYYIRRLSDTDFETGANDENEYTGYYTTEVIYTNQSLYKYSTSENNRLTYEGGYYMHSGQTVWLNDSVSNQFSGIVLCWSAYVNGSPANYNWHYQFVPKEHVLEHSGAGVNTIMATTDFNKVGSKYVYVYDNKIVGNDTNSSTGTKSGITFANNYWVLRYVIGV